MPWPYCLSSGLVPARSVPCSRTTWYGCGVRRRRHSSSSSATSKLLPAPDFDDAPRPLKRPKKPSAISLASPTAVEPATNLARARPVGKRAAQHPGGLALMYLFAGAGMRAKQLRGRARDPAPDDAGQLVVAAFQPLRFALGDGRGLASVPPYQQERGFPDLALIGHHHRRKSRRA